MRILLVCALGMSTSLLVRKMTEYADQAGIADMYIEARPISEVRDLVKDFDAVLLGPQVRFQEGSVRDIIHGAGLEYAIIPTIVYGRLDAKSAVELAISVAEKKKV